MKMPSRHIVGEVLFYVVSAILFGLLLAYLIQPVKAHMAQSGWSYPASCCSGRDCAEVPVTDVKTVAGGFLFTVRPGLHPTTKETRTHLVPYHATKRSPDNLYHICISEHSQNVICAFVPGFGA